MTENDNNKKPDQPEMSPENQARRKNITKCCQEVTFFVMNQVGIVRNGKIDINVAVKDGYVQGIAFFSEGKRDYPVEGDKPRAEEGKEDG